MKRKTKPSEVIFPELLLPKKIKGQTTITYLCPDCNSNDIFDILEVVFAAKAVKVKVKGTREEMVWKDMSGRYKCKCRACGFETVITSKSPMPES